MFSFMKIATIAALAFGTVASAIPAPAPAPVAEARDLEERGGQTYTSILSALPGQLAGPIGQLNALTAESCNPTVVANILVEVTATLDAAVTACKGLPAGAIGGGNLLVLLNAVITLVLNACIRVYNLPGVDKVNIQIVIKAAIDVVLAGLISVVLDVLGLVVILLSALLSLLGSLVINIFVTLKLSACISVLGIVI